MKFSREELNPGSWFSFDDQDPSAGRISLRVANLDKVRALDKATTKKRVEYKQGQRFEVREENHDAYLEGLWDYVIVEWEGLEWDDGSPIECTRENKIKLMTGHVGFAAFINSCLTRLREDQENLEALASKNESSTSSDSSSVRPVRCAKK